MQKPLPSTTRKLQLYPRSQLDNWALRFWHFETDQVALACSLHHTRKQREVNRPLFSAPCGNSIPRNASDTATHVAKYALHS